MEAPCVTPVTLSLQNKSVKTSETIVYEIRPRRSDVVNANLITKGMKLKMPPMSRPSKTVTFMYGRSELIAKSATTGTLLTGKVAPKVAIVSVFNPYTTSAGKNEKTKREIYG